MAVESAGTLISIPANAWTPIHQNAGGATSVDVIQKFILANPHATSNAIIDVRVRSAGALPGPEDDTGVLIKDWILRPSSGNTGFVDLREIVGGYMNHDQILEVRSSLPANCWFGHIRDTLGAG